MKPPSTTPRNVSHWVSSQPDIPLLAKSILSFTAAKDQTSKRLLQNELDLTTQKSQSPCSTYFYPVKFVEFHLEKVPARNHQAPAFLRSCRFAIVGSKPHLLCRLQSNGEMPYGCVSKLYWFPARITTTVASEGTHHFEMIWYCKQRNFTTETSPSSSQTTFSVCISTVQLSIQTPAQWIEHLVKSRVSCAFWGLSIQHVEQMQKSSGKQEPPQKVRANKKQKLRCPISP